MLVSVDLLRINSNQILQLFITQVKQLTTIKHFGNIGNITMLCCFSLLLTRVVLLF